MAMPTHEPRKGFFVVGEIILLAKHDNILENNVVPQWVNDLWEHCGITYPPGEVSSVTFGQEGSLSSIINVPVLPLLEQPGEHEPQLEEKDRALISLLSILNSVRGVELNGIRLHIATPNWCVTSLGHSLTHPCPGGGPSHVDNSDLHQNKHKFLPNKFDNVINDGSEPGQMPVNVVIFDAVAPNLDKDETYDQFAPHELLDDLKALKTAGKFVVKYAKDIGVNLPENLYPYPIVKGTDPNGYSHQDMYKMSDHGSFIAGIITTIAPNASIYLVETQNNFGVGSITSLVQGIKALIDGKIIPSQTEDGEHDERIDYPLIVNCSLCIDFEPIEALEALGYDTSHLAEDRLSLDTALRQLEIQFWNTQVRIIAAAGNNGADTANAKPAACFPAGFDFVFGVGSLEYDAKRAWYSNKADSPPYDGFLVSGGRADLVNGKNKSHAQGEGMLGVYIGEFPDEAPNENGWAWWAGTSFATGVMSGEFARAVAIGMNINRGGPNDLRIRFELHKSGVTAPDGEPYIMTPQRR